MQIFDFKGNEVRTMFQDNKVIMNGKDICRALDIKNHRDALSRLESDERESVKATTLGGKQNTIFVNESGLYNLIFSSNKPEAKEFKHWVTHEVLPSIRKHGAYITEPTLEAMRMNYSTARKILNDLYNENVSRLQSMTEYFSQTKFSGWILAVNVYADYLEFCKAKGYKPLARSDFGKHTIVAGVGRKRTNKGSSYLISEQKGA